MPVPTILANAYFMGAQSDRVTNLVTIDRGYYHLTVTKDDFNRVYAALTGGAL